MELSHCVQLTLWDEKPDLRPYWEWEDFKAGMYKKANADQFAELLRLSCDLLASESLCESAMLRVIHEWPVASMKQLHDATVNRRPWLGRACCCIAHRATDDVVREAWWDISEASREQANRIADSVIARWEAWHA